jgi:hypothetical protein
MAFPEAAPVVNPNGFNGGNGGGSNWTALSAGTFGTKLEVQSNHSFAGSLTKVRGRWTHKAGTEYRNLLSHYADPEQASVAIPSPTAHTGGNFNFEYVTANGSVAQQTRINAQRGVSGAALLLGAGLWTIRPGANVLPHFSQKYFAVYSQNDWRPTPNLTLNLGLRWELQPGPTERENRMSAWDFTKANPFGTQGAVAFPGVDGYSRNLWDTEYDNWGRAAPRVPVEHVQGRHEAARGRRARLGNRDQPVRIAERQRPQQRGVDQREDRAVGADPERQREDRDDSEGGRDPQLPERELEIIPELVDPDRDAHATISLSAKRRQLVCTLELFDWLEEVSERELADFCSDFEPIAACSPEVDARVDA